MTRVSFTLTLMRGCAKPGCLELAGSTVALRYAERIVVVGDLLPRPDPNFLELCPYHARRLTPPRGWSLVDGRIPVEPEVVPVMPQEATA